MRKFYTKYLLAHSSLSFRLSAYLLEICTDLPIENCLHKLLESSLEAPAKLANANESFGGQKASRLSLRNQNKK